MRCYSPGWRENRPPYQAVDSTWVIAHESTAGQRNTTGRCLQFCNHRTRNCVQSTTLFLRRHWCRERFVGRYHIAEERQPFISYSSWIGYTLENKQESLMRSDYKQNPRLCHKFRTQFWPTQRNRTSNWRKETVLNNVIVLKRHDCFTVMMSVEFSN